MSVSSLETLRTPKSEGHNDTVDIFSPKFRDRLPVPSFCSRVDSRVLLLQSAISEGGFLPFSVELPDVGGRGGHEEKWGWGDDEFDLDTLDDFPLPPCHVPPLPSNLMTTESSGARTSQMYMTPRPERIAGRVYMGIDDHQDEGEVMDDDDDSRTIIAQTPSSVESGWSDLWSSVSLADNLDHGCKTDDRHRAKKPLSGMIRQPKQA